MMGFGECAESEETFAHWRIFFRLSAWRQDEALILIIVHYLRLKARMMDGTLTGVAQNLILHSGHLFVSLLLLRIFVLRLGRVRAIALEDHVLFLLSRVLLILGIADDRPLAQRPPCTSRL